MKKRYIAPDFEMIRLTLRDVILTSQTESEIDDQFGNGEGGEYNDGDDLLGGL